MHECISLQINLLMGSWKIWLINTQINSTLNNKIVKNAVSFYKLIKKKNEREMQQGNEDAKWESK